LDFTLDEEGVFDDYHLSVSAQFNVFIFSLLTASVGELSLVKERLTEGERVVVLVFGHQLESDCVSSLDKSRSLNFRGGGVGADCSLRHFK
jgi:hypothetical protein